MTHKERDVLELYQRILDSMQYPNDRYREALAKNHLAWMEVVYGIEETQRLISVTASVIEQELANIRSEREAPTV